MPPQTARPSAERVAPLLARLRRSAEWRFLGVLPPADRNLAAAWCVLVLVCGALPAAFTIAMGALVGAAQNGEELTGPLAAGGILFVAMKALGPLHWKNEASGSNGCS